MREAAIFVHVLGLLLWIGGTVAGALTAAHLAAAPKEARGEGLIAVRRVMIVLGVPGVLLAWAGGLGMLVPGWSETYAHAGWMHGKLTVALLLTALGGMLTGRIRRAAAGSEPSAPALRGLAIAFLVLAAMAVALVAVRPGA